MADLELCAGPECPRCGCTDTVIIRPPADPPDVDPDERGVWFSDGRAACQFCNTEFCFRATKAKAK